MKINFYFDFETRSQLDLKKAGAVRYAMHPSTQFNYISYIIGEGQLKSWSLYSGKPFPIEDFRDLFENPHKYWFITHNIEFDFLIWKFVLPRQLGRTIVPPAVTDLYDNMSLSNFFRLGSTLEANASMLAIGMKKHKEGKAIMLKLSKPNKKGEWVIPTEQEHNFFSLYADGDTVILKKCFDRMPKLPSHERELWEWNFVNNMRGIKIDMELVYAMDEIIRPNKEKLSKRFEDITGVSVNSPKAKDWFKKYYPWIVDLRKDTVLELVLDTSYVPEYVKEAINLKYLMAGTALTKVDTAIALNYGGRIYQLFDYAKAQTKRFAGRGIQPQNFPRFDGKRRDKFDLELNTFYLAPQVKRAAPNLVDPLGFVRNLLRRIWLPEMGQSFYAGDFSKIEPTVLFWLLDMGDIPKLWYEEMAAYIYKLKIEEVGKESDERQVGKTAQLSCGYGSGAESFRAKLFQDTGILISMEMATKVVNAYREKYPKVTQLWSDLDNAFEAAVRGRTSVLCNGRVKLYPMTGAFTGVIMELPSGSKLYYHGAGVRTVRFKKKVTKVDALGKKYIEEVEETKKCLTYLEALSNGTIVPKAVYGGLFAENLVSATARDIMAGSILNLQRSQEFDCIGSVHDEAWGKGPSGLSELFARIMENTPQWAHGMKVKAEVNEGVRYLK